VTGCLRGCCYDTVLSLRIKVVIQRIAFIRNGQSTKNHMKIIFRNFNEKMGRYIQIKNLERGFAETSDDNGIKAITLPRQKNLSRARYTIPIPPNSPYEKAHRSNTS
jgi:hypothetical protein